MLYAFLKLPSFTKLAIMSHKKSIWHLTISLLLLLESTVFLFAPKAYDACIKQLNGDCVFNKGK